MSDLRRVIQRQPRDRDLRPAELASIFLAALLLAAAAGQLAGWL